MNDKRTHTTMARIIAIIDNGPGKRGCCCDDCGIALRYEYHTDDGGRYGSECVHRHIHAEGWMTYKAAKDAKILASIERQYKAAKNHKSLTCAIYPDNSAIIRGISRYGEDGTRAVIDRLVGEGWELRQVAPGYFPGARNYHLIASREG